VSYDYNQRAYTFSEYQALDVYGREEHSFRKFFDGSLSLVYRVLGPRLGPGQDEPAGATGATPEGSGTRACASSQDRKESPRIRTRLAKTCAWAQPCRHKDAENTKFWLTRPAESR